MGSQVDDPHKLAASNESSLEIFLFSNGQQDSPPRKYNLRVGEQWNTTLNCLARSQYGSKHTIELYTIDGIQIEGPLELSNGAAYVAVDSPHSFIPAGYQDYLVKATRSRERRQEKIPENDTLPKTVKMSFNDKKEEEEKGATNTKIIQDITIFPIPAKSIQEQQSLTDKVNSDMDNVKPSSRISTFKQTQKKTNSLPQRNPPILRKNTNAFTPVFKKGNNTSKVDTIKKKFENPYIKNTKNTKTNSTITRTTENQSKGDQTDNIPVPSYDLENTGTCDLRKESDTAGLPDQDSAGLKTKYSLRANSTITATPTVIEKNILLPVSHNYEKDHRDSTYISPRRNRSMTDIVSDAEEHHDRTRITDSSTLSSRAEPTESPGRTESKAITQTKTTMSGSQNGDNNFVIYVKQGDLINLKLNIEIQDGSNTVAETTMNEVISTRCCAKIPKSDLETLDNNTAVTKNCCETPTLTEPWLVGLSYEQLQEITNDLKLAICQCHCCSCSGSTKPQPIHIDNNNYVIIFPQEENTKTVISCTCKLEVNQKSKSEVSDYPVLPSTKSIAVQLDEDTSEPPSHTLTSSMAKDPGDGKNPIHDPMPNENQLLSKKISTVEVELNQICNCCETRISQNQTSARNCAQQRLALGPCECDAQQSITPDIFVNLGGSSVKNIANFQETCTQTDWRCIVLEARPRGDGIYEFHMPSLETLKLYNALY